MFSKRSTKVELMDDLDCQGEVINRTLVELEIINTWLGGNDVTISGVKNLLKKIPQGSKIHIGDLGCGGGDMIVKLHTFLSRQQYKPTFLGIDANPNIIAFARENSKRNDDIAFETVDIFSEEFRKLNFDIAIGTLFFHHFNADQLSSFFRQLLNQVRVGIVINDIHRHWFAYYSIKWLTGLFSKSPMVINDAPLSVLRAFSKRELEEILQNAGSTTYTIRWKWAFRWQVIIEK